MPIATNIACLLLLAIVMYQDIESNKIYLIVLLSLLPLALISKQSEWITSLATGVLLVAFPALINIILKKIKGKRSIAIGDFLILAFVGFRFNPISAILIIILSSFSGILFSVITKRNEDIPFAGLIAIISIGFISMDMFNIQINIDSLYGTIAN